MYSVQCTVYSVHTDSRGVIGVSQQNLRSRVSQGSAARQQPLAGVKLVGEAEVCELHLDSTQYKEIDR